MEKNRFLLFLKILIILSPLPFGCVTKIFSPLFYFSILLLSFIGLKGLKSAEQDTSKSLLFAYEGRVKKIVYILFGFILFQVLPLPIFLLKLISPATVANLAQLQDKLPGFHPISMVPYETLVFALELMVLLIFFITFVKIQFRKKQLISIIWIMIISVSAQTIFGLLKLATGSKNFFLFFHYVEKNRTSGFLTGTLGNPDHFAFYIEMIFPLVLTLFFLKLKFFVPGPGLKDKLISTFNQDKYIIITFSIMVLLGIGLFLTGSRSGIITLALSFLIFSQLSFYLKKSKAIRKKLRIIFMVIFVAAVFFGIKNTSEKFLKTSFDKSGRFLRWPNTAKMIYDHPLFGAGFGTYSYTFFLYDTDPVGKWSTHAHNEYMEVLAEGGITGGLIYSLLIITLVFAIFKMWRSRRHPDIRILGIGVLTSIFAAMFHSFFDFPLRIPSNLFIFVLLLAMGVKFATYQRQFTEKGKKVGMQKKLTGSRPGTQNEK